MIKQLSSIYKNSQVARAIGQRWRRQRGISSQVGLRLRVSVCSCLSSESGTVVIKSVVS